MKTITKITTLLMLTISFIMPSGCKKGDTGPAGKDGKDATVNVVSYTTPVNTWSSNSSRWFAQITVPELTSNNINSVAVQAYFSISNGTWIAMPYTAIASTDYFWGFATSTNNVEIRWDYNGIGIGSDPNAFYSTTVQIKVVVIPPAMRKPGVNHNSYSEVKAAYNLQD